MSEETNYEQKISEDLEKLDQLDLMSELDPGKEICHKCGLIFYEHIYRKPTLAEIENGIDDYVEECPVEKNKADLHIGGARS